MLRWIYAGAVAASLTGLVLLLLVSRYPSAGPVVVRLTAAHGIHVGDLGIVAVWALAMLALAGLVSERGAGPSA